jgi:hypothetical protein
MGRKSVGKSTLFAKLKDIIRKGLLTFQEKKNITCQNVQDLA